MTAQEKCPRCEKLGLKTWEQLTDEEHEVVKRLPVSTEYALSERQTSHRWCTRCWFEDTKTGSSRLA